MPTYEYTCKNASCENLDEIISIEHEMALAHEEHCPKCGDKLTRLISGGVGFVLKGSDFSGKNLRVKGQMKERMTKAKRKGFLNREQEMGLVPNHEGEVVQGSRLEPQTWEKVKEVARKKGVKDEETKKQRDLTDPELGTYDRKIKEVAKRKQEEKQNFEELRTPGIIT
jgi:putative FmdB family regulatory protein